MIEQDDFMILQKMINKCEENKIPFIAEGNIDTFEKVQRAIELGAFSVVVGSMITRPQLITRRFTANMFKETLIVNFDDKENINLKK